MNQVMAIKKSMKQAWTVSGKRMPVTVLSARDAYVIDTMDKTEGRILFGIQTKKLSNVNKPQQTHLKKAGLSFGLRHVKELRVDASEKENLTAGATIAPSTVLSVGDIVKVTGTTKGKGFTGVVKRYGFAGGPRTHGQSDRERARGSLGSGTTPGRVFKQKRMAGRSGNAQKTIEGLQVIHIDDASGQIFIRGVVPGTINSFVTITKVSDGKFEGMVENPTLGLISTPAPAEPAIEAQEEVVHEAAPAATTEEVTTV